MSAGAFEERHPHWPFPAPLEGAGDAGVPVSVSSGSVVSQEACGSTEPGQDAPINFRLALDVKHPDCHKAADAFWAYWNANGETHKHGYYESTWGAINRALRMVGVRHHDYGAPPQQEACDAAASELAALTEDDVGALAYRGNTVSYMYDRAKAYGDEIMRTWFAIKEAGLHPGRTEERLSDCVKRLLAAPSPAPAPHATQEGEAQ